MVLLVIIVMYCHINRANPEGITESDPDSPLLIAMRYQVSTRSLLIILIVSTLFFVNFFVIEEDDLFIKLKLQN